jgi:hypothetical protein
MKRFLLNGAAALMFALLLGGRTDRAFAGPVSAVLSANYFEVLNNGSGAPDFGGSGTPNVAAGSALGPNGFPVVSLTSPGITQYNHTTGEITWWSPAMNSAVISTGAGTISLPYGSNMYAPNSTGSADSSAFETAFFQGQFTLASTQNVQFQLGSDDDSFIYVDNILIGDNPGIHGVTNVNFTANNLAAGLHSLEVFYDDRAQTGAYLSLNLLSSDVVITPPSPPVGVPEPLTVSLFGGGLVGLAALRRPKKRLDGRF